MIWKTNTIKTQNDVNEFPQCKNSNVTQNLKRNHFSWIHLRQTTFCGPLFHTFGRITWRALFNGQKKKFETIQLQKTWPERVWYRWSSVSVSVNLREGVIMMSFQFLFTILSTLSLLIQYFSLVVLLFANGTIRDGRNFCQLHVLRIYLRALVV